jgi:hypothetical protein
MLVVRGSGSSDSLTPGADSSFGTCADSRSEIPASLAVLLMSVRGTDLLVDGHLKHFGIFPPFF